MPQPRIEFLSQQDLQAIHETSLAILRDTGVNVHNAGVRLRLLDAGARALPGPSSARLVFDETMVESTIQQAGKGFILHGRDPGKTARFGLGDQNVISSPGQYAWFDHRSGARRAPLLADARLAGRLGDALENITIVGGMAVPVDVPEPIRDVV
jgi:trimethylamine--corrinoid protein Co-methyltransferase